jgi:hypothetical protein
VHDRLERGEVPVPYIVIETHMGFRAYAEKELADVFGSDAYRADGTYTAGGSITAGSASSGVLEKAARVVRFGSFERSLQGLKEDIMGSYQSKTLQHVSVGLDNSDGKFARLIASEPFIGRPLAYYVGFPELPQSTHLKTFSGIITEMRVMDTVTIEADEE